MRPKTPVEIALDKMPLPAMTLKIVWECADTRTSEFLPCIFSFLSNVSRGIEARHRPGSKKAYERWEYDFALIQK